MNSSTLTDGPSRVGDVAMFMPMRWLFGTALGILALLGPLSETGQAQYPAAVLQTQAMLNSPLASGMGVVGFPGAGFGNAWGYGSLINNAGFGLRGGFGLYGGLGLYGGFGLYGSLYSGYGAYGYSPQWMMNPYEGYLEGAAKITKGNANYYHTIQQAKLLRQEAIRSSLQTRRAMLEEAEYERAHAPDPEKIRQLVTAHELDRARANPPLVDIWAARSLNSLLQHLVAAQAEGAKGPKVPLSEDILNHVNLTTGESRGNIGLLKDAGRLKWPKALKEEMFSQPRDHINSLMSKAYQALHSGERPDEATLSDLQANYKQMLEILGSNGERLSVDDYMQANRYLTELRHTIAAMKDRNVVNHFNSNWTPQVKSVAELVRFMRDKGLVFAPATQRDEAAYVSLYHALAEFDAGVPRLTRNSYTGTDNK
jgi:hypothetical protein